MDGILKVGVLRGGATGKISHDYDASLEKGNFVLNNLPERCKPVDIFVDKSGLWHVQGLPATESRLKGKVDVVFNALHGPFGLIGGGDQVLKNMGLPYTGHVWNESSLPVSRAALNFRLRELGLQTPFFETVEEDALSGAQKIFTKMSPPWRVLPPVVNTASPIYLARDLNELITALKLILEDYGSAYVEENISGQSATSGVVEQFRNKAWYQLPAQGDLNEIQKREIENLAEKIHLNLGLRHYCQIDFIVSPKRGVFVINVLPLPHLEGSFQNMLEYIGCSLSNFLDHAIFLAREY